ncbi:DNA-binding beta-propeller fold protein YncE [Sphingomonas sp. UYAg733]
MLLRSPALPFFLSKGPLMFDAPRNDPLSVGRSGRATLRRALALAGVAGMFVAMPAAAQLVGIAVDPEAVMVNGELAPPAAPAPDSVVFLEFGRKSARTMGKVLVPSSFMGPPSSVVIARDRRFALASASSRVEAGAFVPNRTVSLIDLAGAVPRVAQTLTLAAAPSSLALSPDASFALAPHGDNDSVSVLRIVGGVVSVRTRIDFAKGSKLLAAAIAPDGLSALVSFAGTNKVGVFRVVDGEPRLPAMREIGTGVYPTIVSYCGATGMAIVANYGTVSGDADTVSLIDLTGAAPRIVDTATVGPSPEGAACSPDGRYVAAAVQNMSTVASGDPLYAPTSLVVLLRIKGKKLVRVAEAAIGGWAQGVGFLDDGRTLFAESIADRSVHVFRIAGDRLTRPMPPLVLPDGGPVGHGIAGR